MANKNLTKIIEIDPLLENINIVADQERLSQVILNLLLNALKYTRKGFIKISV